MNNDNTIKYIKSMFEKDLFALVFPDDGKYESAQAILDQLGDTAIGSGIGRFQKDGKIIYGVLVNKIMLKEQEDKELNRNDNMQSK